MEEKNIFNILEKLIKLTNKYEVRELTINWADGKNKIFYSYSTRGEKLKSRSIFSESNEKENKSAKLPGITKSEDNNYYPILAPLTGTFYHSPSPDSPPFVREGDFITKGQTLGLIEAMKLFNELKSEIEGRILKILAKDAELVKKEQVLFLVEVNVK
jgi:acetyl-CoA carboxylase biotin carboxyl carrier protein